MDSLWTDTDHTVKRASTQPRTQLPHSSGALDVSDARSLSQLSFALMPLTAEEKRVFAGKESPKRTVHFLTALQRAS